MKTMILVILTAAITNNYVLVKFLGICPFLGVSKKLDQATGMSLAVIFVEVLATAVTWPIYHFLLAGKVDFTYMETVVVILVIAALVQLVEIVLKRYVPALHKSLGVYLPLSPGRLLLCCGAVLAVLRGVLFCFGRAGTRCFAAVLELEGAVLSVQAFCDTGFSVQDPLTGQAVVLVYYPAVRSALPPELRTFLDRYFACGTAPPPELRVRLVPCTTIAGHCVLPAVPAKALRTSKGSAAGILAAFCRPETQQPWTALLGSELAVQLGIR